MVNTVVNYGPCIVEGCDMEQHCRGYCRKHYTRVMRHGSAEVYNKTGPKIDQRPLFERVIENLEYEPNTGCWLWTGPVAGWGYGVIGRNVNRKKRVHYVHRVSYEYHIGNIPADKFVCHKCDIPRCVNPQHLFLATPMENTHDMMAKDRGRGLSQREVFEIRELLEEGELTQLQIGVRYDIHQATVSEIKLGKRWALGKNRI